MDPNAQKIAQDTELDMSGINETKEHQLRGVLVLTRVRHYELPVNKIS